MLDEQYHPWKAINACTDGFPLVKDLITPTLKLLSEWFINPILTRVLLQPHPYSFTRSDFSAVFSHHFRSL